ncbi:MAG: (deoxy)nucleoside triphosphate pyrophosphohydrolase [Gammaproteobacteria bacterium]|nr:(deoxy)nucleoside triphosphate pyrophosphohydrolase [Gammaproteobacteria bacterium]
MSWEVRLKPLRVVVGIVKKQEKILIGQRPIGKPYSGYWEFPGGKIEENESGQEALTRELYEELGVQVETAYFCFEHTHTYPDKTVLLEIWLVSAFSGEPYCKENQILRWVTFTEMMELRVLEGNLPIVEKIKNSLSSAKSL